MGTGRMPHRSRARAAVKTVFVDGQFVSEDRAMVPVTDRCFRYGDGLFETLRVCHGVPFRWEDHWRRFQAGARLLDIRIPGSAEETLRWAVELCGRNRCQSGVLRYQLSRGSGPRGYSPHGAGRPMLVMSAEEGGPGALPTVPARLRTSSYRVTGGNFLGGHKTANKLLQVLARAEAERQGADEALLLTQDGFVAEAGAANLFWVQDGQLVTPPVELGIVPGITRKLVMDLAKSEGWPTQEVLVSASLLPEAEGIFLTQSASGIVPVGELDGRPVAVNAMGRTLRERLERLVEEETRRWAALGCMSHEPIPLAER